MQNAVIQRCSALPDGVGELVQLASDEGHLFMSRLVREWHSGENRFEAPGEALLVARVGSSLVGICGLNVDPYAGDARVGRTRHLYVAPAFRRHGIATALVSEVIALARMHFLRLRLRTAQAGSFYERLGFEPCDDLEATHVMKLISSGS